MNVEDSTGESSLETSLLHNLSLTSQDPVNQDVPFQHVSPGAYTSQHGELPHLRLPPGYSISISSSDLPLHHSVPRFPAVSSQIPPPSLTLQPPTSPPCVQSYGDNFQPPLSPSELLSHYGYNSSLSSPGLGYHRSPSPLSLSPQPAVQPPGSPRCEQPSPSCYKRHLSLPTSPSQPLVSKFNFLTPPLQSPAAAHRSPMQTAFPLPPRAVSPVPLGSPSAAVGSPASGDTLRRIGAPGGGLLSPASPRHMLTVPMASSPCRSPSYFGPSLQPYQHSRSRSPSPISKFCGS